MLNAVHFFIWSFIDALKKEDFDLNRFKVEQAIAVYSSYKNKK